jgi:hypothetical protein
MAHVQRRRGRAEFFNQEDASVYMLGVRKSHAGLAKWFVLTVLAGSALALLLFVVATYF